MKRQLQTTYLLAFSLILVLASCSQARYGSRTIRVKGDKADQTVTVQKTQKNQKTATMNVKEEAEVMIDQQSSTTPKTKDVVSIPQLENPVSAIIVPVERKAKTAALSTKVQEKVMNNKRVAKAINKIENKVTEVNSKSATDSDSLLRDILVIILIVLLVSLILSLLPNPLSYILSVVLTILLLLYLIQMLT